MCHVDDETQWQCTTTTITCYVTTTGGTWWRGSMDGTGDADVSSPHKYVCFFFFLFSTKFDYFTRLHVPPPSHCNQRTGTLLSPWCFLTAHSSPHHLNNETQQRQHTSTTCHVNDDARRWRAMSTTKYDDSGASWWWQRGTLMGTTTTGSDDTTDTLSITTSRRVCVSSFK